MISVVLVIILLHQILPGSSRVIYPGPKYPPTRGEVWPRPQIEIKLETYYVLNVTEFKIINSAQSCDVLNRAIARYSNILSHLDRLTEPDDATPDPDTHLNSNDALYQGNLHRLFISLKSECETLPHHDMDERYNITIQSSNSVLSSSSVWGILRGLETFVQLFYVSQDYSQIRINETVIVDYPQYKFRGLLIDTGRHYLHLDKILKSLDAMEMNKMNVLHWHIVDDQSFPYQSEAFPELSAKGAFHHSLIYTKKDIKTIVKYAKNRGIRVLVEFDVPGHVRSWGAAFPKILTECYKSNKVVGLGPLNPIENGTYEFLRLLYREVLDRFPDSYLHIGGDEVDLACWSSNPKIQKYMKEKSLTTSQLHAEFMSKVYKLLPNHIKTLVWQEVYDNAVSLPDDTLIQVWKYEWITEMDKILKSGHQVVFSSSWYLDYLDQGWELFYKADPREMVYKLHKDESRLQNIVGGEACMWGEMVDDSNVVSRTWPRASTVAERLWTGVDYKNPSDLAVNDFVRRRLEGHTCRMVQRGVHAEPPSGPGFCLS